MALTFVGSASNTATNGGDVTVTLPSMQEGDVVYAIGGSGRAGGLISISTTGYTTLGTHDFGSFALSAVLGRKVMGAAPDSSITFSGSGHSLDAIAGAVHVWRGADTTTPEDAATVEVTGDSELPDCGLITTQTDGAEVLALIAHEIPEDPLAFPSGYSNTLSDFANDTLDAGIAIASKNVATAGAENPGAYSYDGAGRWVAFTVAIKPAAGASGHTGEGALIIPSFSISGTGVQHPSGTGSLSLQPFSIDASGTQVQNVTATGDLSINTPTIDGTAKQIFSATGSLDIGTPTIDASGEQGAITATGSLTVQSFTVEGTATQDIPGQGALTIGNITLDATGVMQPSGVGNLILPLFSIDATGTGGPMAGTGTLVLAGIVLDALGAIPPEGVGSLNLQPIIVSSLGISEKLDITDTDILQKPVDYQLAGHPPVPGAFTVEGETRVGMKVRMRSGGRLSGGKPSFTVKTDNRGFD